MRFLLVAPDVTRNVSTPELLLETISPTLGINYLQTVLKQKGHRVITLDTLYYLALRRQGFKKEITEWIREVIKKEGIEVVGISITSQTRRKCLNIARLVKNINKNIIVVLGGAYATVMYKQLLNFYPSLFDFIVIGEGEITLPALIQAIEEKSNLMEIPGIAFRKNLDDEKSLFASSPREVIHDLDALPFPNYDHYLHVLPNGKIKTVTILTSRGCPFSCSFCGVKSIWRGIRYQSPKNVAIEIDHLINNYGVEDVRIMDDCFGYPRERAIRILEEIVRKKIKLKNFYAHARLDFMNKEVLQWYKKVGGRQIYYGLESGSLNIRKLMGKPISDERIFKTIKTTKEMGISIGIFVMFGYPKETIEDIKKTYEMVERIDPDEINCAVTKIQPASYLYRLAKEKGIMKEDDWLNEEIDYFTWSKEEKLKDARGFQILFSERFTKQKIHSDFEHNPEVVLLKKDKSLYEELKQRAIDNLRKVGINI